jgi:putative transposase
MALKISRMGLWKIKKRYDADGDYGIKNHKCGRLFESLNPRFYDLVVKEWKKYKCGARKLHVIMRKKGFLVSLRKISQVMVAEGFQKPNLKKQKPRKYKRYEWPIANYMWHTDWHVLKRPDLKGKWFISYIDDSSRKIMAHGVFDAPTTRNSLVVLYKAIATHCVIPVELNSDRGSQFIPNKFDKKGKANSTFQESLEELGTFFVPSRARHPQTNGKLEKFHHTLEREFDERFKTLEEFIEWYNDERPSEAVDYLTPNEAYKKRI